MSGGRAASKEVGPDRSVDSDQGAFDAILVRRGALRRTWDDDSGPLETGRRRDRSRSIFKSIRPTRLFSSSMRRRLTSSVSDKMIVSAFDLNPSSLCASARRATGRSSVVRIAIYDDSYAYWTSRSGYVGGIPVEGRHDLDVERVGHQIERERLPQDEAFAREAGGVATERLRIARDVDQAAARGERRGEVLAFEAGTRRIGDDGVGVDVAAGRGMRGPRRPGGVAAAALDGGAIGVAGQHGGRPRQQAAGEVPRAGVELEHLARIGTDRGAHGLDERRVRVTPDLREAACGDPQGRPTPLGDVDVRQARGADTRRANAHPAHLPGGARACVDDDADHAGRTPRRQRLGGIGRASGSRRGGSLWRAGPDRHVDAVVAGL